jgi:hypothetical protein
MNCDNFSSNKQTAYATIRILKARNDCGYDHAILLLPLSKWDLIMHPILTIVMAA